MLKKLNLLKLELFGCLRGTLLVTKMLGGYFVSSKTVRYLDESYREFEEIE